MVVRYVQLNFVYSGARPGIVTYNTLLEVLCREGKLDAALKVLSDVEHSAKSSMGTAIEPNNATYTMLIKACCKEGRAPDAEALWCRLLQRGLAPDRRSYTALIDAYAKGGMVEQVNVKCL